MANPFNTTKIINVGDEHWVDNRQYSHAGGSVKVAAQIQAMAARLHQVKHNKISKQKCLHKQLLALNTLLSRTYYARPGTKATSIKKIGKQMCVCVCNFSCV